MKAKRVLLAEVPLKGYFTMDKKNYRNRFTRNMGYALDFITRRVSGNLYDQSNTARSQSATYYGSFNRADSSTYDQGSLFFMGLGGGVASPSVNDYILASEVFKTPTDSKLIEDLASSTKLRFFARYSNHVGLDLSEVGLFWLFNAPAIYWGLLARSLVSPPITIPSLSDRSDAYTLEFSAGYTRWFVRALVCAISDLDAKLGTFTNTDTVASLLYDIKDKLETFEAGAQATSGSGSTTTDKIIYTGTKVGTVTVSLSTSGIGFGENVIIRYYIDPANPVLYIQKTVVTNTNTAGWTDTAAAWQVMIDITGTGTVNYAYSVIYPPS